MGLAGSLSLPSRTQALSCANVLREALGVRGARSRFSRESPASKAPRGGRTLPRSGTSRRPQSATFFAVCEQIRLLRFRGREVAPHLTPGSADWSDATCQALRGWSAAVVLDAMLVAGVAEIGEAGDHPAGHREQPGPVRELLRPGFQYREVILAHTLQLWCDGRSIESRSRRLPLASLAPKSLCPPPASDAEAQISNEHRDNAQPECEGVQHDLRTNPQPISVGGHNGLHGLR